MYSLRLVVLFSLFYNTLLHLASQTIAQPDFVHTVCSNVAGNFTTDSDFRRNLNELLSSLTSNTKIDYGFYNISVGQNGTDQANAIALCRGDIGVDDCRKCIRNATITLLQLCPIQKEAIGVYDTCVLRYSNKSIFGVKEDFPKFMIYRTQNASDVNLFNQGLQTLTSRLRIEAASGNSLRKFATINGSAGFDTIFGLAQCTPDLSEQQCDDCLAMAFGDGRILGKREARITTPSCNFRYDDKPFFGVTPSTPTSEFPQAPPVPPPTEGGKRSSKTTWIIIGATLSAIVVLLFSYGSYTMWRRKKMKREKLQNSQVIQLLDLEGRTIEDEYSNEIIHGEMKSQDSPLIRLDVVLEATKQFANENKLGQGGFGPVYKGIMEDGKEIAVKRLSITSGQGLREFMNEVTLIARLQHRNLVKLFGCCLEKNEKLLIYEYMPNKSLDVFLFDSAKRVQLDWQRRLNIINGIARGLLYLHEDSRLRIIHRDLKASNILLDYEMNPKISDFGMARIFGGNQSEANTNRIVGTYGYMAPEYAMEGISSVKSDAFSFGVLMLEIISGKRNGGFHLSDEGKSLLTYAWKLWSEGQGLELMDSLIEKPSIATEVLKCIHIGLLCVQEDPADRPTMSSVVFMLAGDNLTLPIPTQPAFSVGRIVAKETTSSNHRVCSVNEVTLSIVSPR